MPDERTYLKSHTLQADLLRLDLAAELAALRKEQGEQPQRGVALVKDAPLTLLLTALRTGGILDAHQARGPVMVQVLEGSVIVTTDGRQEPAPAGTVVALGPNVRHEVRAVEDSALLITVIDPGAGRPGS